ncbi:MAG TPA: fructosamine kinase family protein [Nocardioidaceae bacterium]|nr:fructosamine kinase family protein [Nocardioidaceae bacterium]
MARMGTIASRAEALLGSAVVATTAVAGGDICTATRLRLSNGHSALIKTRPHPPAGFFPAEARGLAWLSAAGGACVPKVLASAEDCLILAWVERGVASPEAAEDFGRQLAKTHAAGAESFGASEDGFIGMLPLPNAPADSWAEFFATRRVLPYLKAARDRGAVTTDDAAVIEQVLRRLDELAGPAEPPARIHGDMWSGNVLWSADRDVWLIDPAAHGGHRETDLAMLALFGTPHLTTILAAYEEQAPLAEGWQERLPLHQLHPLLVHAVHFGGGYGARAADAARAVLDGSAGGSSH